MDEPVELLVVSSNYPSASYPHSGVFVVRQARLLAAHGVRCRFVVPRLPDLRPLRRVERWHRYADRKLTPPPGQQARRALFVRPPGAAFTTHEGLLKSPGALATAVAFHRERRAHAVLGVDLTSNGWAAVVAARALGLPVANLAIGSDVMWRPRHDPRLRSRLQWVARRSDLLLGVSEQLCVQLRELVGDAAPIDRVYLGREPVTPMQPAQREARRGALGVGPDDLVMVYGGRLTEEKGMGELLQVMPSLLSNHPRLHLLCLGDGPLRGQLQDLSRERVHCPGWVEPEALHAWFAASDLLVFPSHSEGLPQTVLEAMDRALPVVATDVGGTREAVIDGETGALVPPRAPDALASALEPFLRDAALRARAGAAGQRRAATVFDPDRNARHMADALRRMIGVHRRT